MSKKDYLGHQLIHHIKKHQAYRNEEGIHIIASKKKKKEKKRLMKQDGTKARSNKIKIKGERNLELRNKNFYFLAIKDKREEDKKLISYHLTAKRQPPSPPIWPIQILDHHHGQYELRSLALPLSPI